jgi:dTMP kinase
LPDLTLFFDIVPKLGIERINKNSNREINRLDLEGIDFHNKVYAGYKKVIALYEERFEIVDASKSIDQVYQDVVVIIEKKLKEK